MISVCFNLFGCSTLGNIESASKDLMIVEEEYVAYEWENTDRESVSVEEALKTCKHSLSATGGYISKRTAYKELKGCLKEAGWEKVVTEIVLQGQIG